MVAIPEIPVIAITVFWAVVGIIGPCLVPKGPNKGLIQMSLVLTAVTCWLLWWFIYLSQANPLIGPRLQNRTALSIVKEWEGFKFTEED